MMIPFYFVQIIVLIMAFANILLECVYARLRGMVMTVVLNGVCARKTVVGMGGVIRT